jgi:hypothetical protein
MESSERVHSHILHNDEDPIVAKNKGRLVVPGRVVPLVPSTNATAVTEENEEEEVGLWDDEHTRCCWNNHDQDSCSSNNNNKSSNSNSSRCGSRSSSRAKRLRKQSPIPSPHPHSPKIPAWQFWKKNAPILTSSGAGGDLEQTLCRSQQNHTEGGDSLEKDTRIHQSVSLATITTTALPQNQHQQHPHPSKKTRVDDDDDDDVNGYVRMESTVEDDEKNSNNHHATKQQLDDKNGRFPNWSVLLSLQWKEQWKSRRITCCWIGMSASALAGIVLLVVSLALLAVVVPAMLYYNPRRNGSKIVPNSIFSTTTRRAAFLGNSITFVNDLPRFMENLSGNSIQQSSCLHASVNFGTLLQKGNGMYNKWRTDNAIIDYYDLDDDEEEENDEKTPVYDFGACTVKQLLLGYDSSLYSDSNNNNNNNNNGNNNKNNKSRLNPCYRDSNYLEYINDHQNTELWKRSKKWDYVIMNDQTLYPGTVEKREKSTSALGSTYAEYLIESKATPVFIVTYGYSKAAANSDDDASSDDDAAADNEYSSLGDIPEFTSRIYYGYKQYRETLKDLLPNRQRPLLAPVGLAFLVIYEENYEFWLELFYDDGFHPSPHGTFLMGCCLYATMYGSMPPKLPKSDDDVMTLFGNARMMHSNSMGDDKSLPTAEEAEYLAEIAKRVVLDGYIPATLLDSDTVVKMEAEESSGNNDRRKFRW